MVGLSKIGLAPSMTAVGLGSWAAGMIAGPGPSTTEPEPSKIAELAPNTIAGLAPSMIAVELGS